MRVGACCGLALLLATLGSKSLQTAVANGDTRTLSLHNVHTDEDLTVTFKRNGRYDQEALNKLNWILRDWRQNEEIKMDPHLFDLVWEVRHEFGDDKVIDIICGYRSPQTNAMLRSRSRGVAQFSQHMLGKAMDFFIPDVPLEQLRVAGLRLQRGGVGYYPTSGSPFVHMDVGNVRHWPRMTRQQLVSVFPDGRTVHIPTDGVPLKNYALALADIERRGKDPSALSLQTARNAGVIDASDIHEDRNVAPAQPTVVASAPPPLPHTRPEAATISFQLASAASRPVQLDAGAPKVSANAVIEARGFWRGLPQESAEFSAAARTSVAPRLAYAAPPPTEASLATGSISRWLSGVSQAHAATIEGPLTAARQPATAAAPMGTRLSPPPTVPPATTLAIKATRSTPTVALTAPPPKTSLDNPWLRAMVLSPSARDYMKTTLYGRPDFDAVAALMVAPPVSVMMTFSNDPHLGMRADRFAGAAIVFMPTVTFTTKTAALQ